MQVPLHIQPDDFTVEACHKRALLYVEAAAHNQKGFRSPRTSRIGARRETPYRIDFIARIGSLKGKDELAKAVLRHGAGLPVRRALGQ